MDLFDFIEPENQDDEERPLTLCPHVYHVGAAKNSGWTLDADPASPYFGAWVDSSPDCRRPAFRHPNLHGARG